MMLSSVDLPQPDGPMIDVNSPAAIVEVDAVERAGLDLGGAEDFREILHLEHDESFAISRFSS